MSGLAIFIVKCDECGRLAKCRCLRPPSISLKDARTHAADCMGWEARNRNERDHIIDLCPLCQAAAARRNGLPGPRGRRRLPLPRAAREGFDLLTEQRRANDDRALLDRILSSKPPAGGAGGSPPPPPSPAPAEAGTAGADADAPPSGSDSGIPQPASVQNPLERQVRKTRQDREGLPTWARAGASEPAARPAPGPRAAGSVPTFNDRRKGAYRPCECGQCPSRVVSFCPAWEDA